MEDRGVDVVEQENCSSAIVIRRGLREGQEPAAAELYWQAFGRKLGYPLGPPDKGTRFIAQHLNRDRAVVAVADGRLIGLAGYHHDGRALTDVSAADVLRAYGWIRGLPKLAVLALLERQPHDRELLMDGIVVEESWRGQGVGTRLLAELVTLADALGCTSISLDVVDTNPGAHALYERVGFEPVKTERTPYLSRLMGFSASTTMRLAVEPRPDVPRGDTKGR